MSQSPGCHSPTLGRRVHLQHELLRQVQQAKPSRNQNCACALRIMLIVDCVQQIVAGDHAIAGYGCGIQSIELFWRQRLKPTHKHMGTGWMGGKEPPIFFQCRNTCISQRRRQVGISQHAAPKRRDGLHCLVPEALNLRVQRLGVGLGGTQIGKRAI